MIQRQSKLRLTVKQEKKLEQWLWYLTGVYNWAIRKIELDAHDKIYHSSYEFMGLLNGHSSRMGISLHTLRATAMTAYNAWQRCFKKLSGRPKFKGQRNKLNSILFTDGFSKVDDTHFKIQSFGKVKFFKQNIPSGKIKQGRLIKKPSGWYLCLVIDAEPNKIPILGDSSVGIDPGFNHLLTLSNGEKIEHPRELEKLENKLAQAQRGKRTKLAGRIQERIANQRKDRNHKLSRRLVSNNRLIVFSADKHSLIAKEFGKSVASSGHYQLRSMLAYKCRLGGRQYTEVSSRNSTKTCSVCGLLSGPTGWQGLKVRHWVCSCGAEHDRDVNAAMNTLKAGAGIALEIVRKASPKRKRVNTISRIRGEGTVGEARGDES